MEIMPINKVRLIKGVPFTISYQDIIQFDNSTAQLNYFNSLPHLEIDNITYVRQTTKIKVPYNRESLLDYNYLYFQNSNYGDKIFYAFITKVEYVNPNTSAISFVIDEWQTWCFDITFMPTFIERKHCQRWNSDGSPVINTIDEGLDYGSEYITKDHEQYNNDLYWICFVTSIDLSNANLSAEDVPTILTTFYLPIYKTTTSLINTGKITTEISGVTFGGNFSSPNNWLTEFRNNTALTGTLVSCFITSESPFEYNYTINNNSINVNITGKGGVAQIPNATELGYVAIFSSDSVPARITRTFSKYGNLKNNITESKLLMYPYSYVQLIDGQGNNFIIKPEYLNSSNIQIETFTSGGLNSKQAHIVQNYRYTASLNQCRWELQNGIINSYNNNLTIIDDYTAASLQGNSNTINNTINNTQLQSNLNNTMTQNTADAAMKSAILQSAANAFGQIAGGAIMGAAIPGGLTAAQGAIISGVQSIGQSVSQIGSTAMENKALIENTELQGQLTNQKTIATEMAKVQDAKMVADNVALQGGDVYFTYQNQFSGYCLVYRQISNEYIAILENYFKKYGYKVNTIEIPNLHTRESWNYIRTIDCNIKASINAESLEKLRTMFNNGVTVWHTTDVGNYTLSNNEI